MFYGCSSLVTLPDLSQWDTNKLTDISYMFIGCSSLKSIPDISNWKLNKVTDMSNMFCACTSLTTLPDISNWKTNKVINMSNMFCGCSSLKSLPDISKWNISNVTNLSGMFYACSSLFVLPNLSIWNTINVKDISRIFGLCTSLYFLPNYLKWNFDNMDKSEGFLEGIKVANTTDGLSILEGKKLPHKNHIYKNLFNYLMNRYPRSSWLLAESQDYHNLQDYNYLINENKSQFDNFKYLNITYDIRENEDIIQIFSNNFGIKNKYKFKIIYRNKIIKPYEEFAPLGNNTKKLKLKLILLDKVSINNNDIKGFISPLKYDEISGYKDKYKIFPSKLKNLLDEYQFEIQFYQNQYCKIDLNDYFLYAHPSFHTYYELLYKNDMNQKRIKIFGAKFVNNNKDKCIIIYNDIILPLQEYLPVNNNTNYNIGRNDDKIEILLLELENISNKSSMFYDCASLVEFSSLKYKKEDKVKFINNGESEDFTKSQNIYNDSEGHLTGSESNEESTPIQKMQNSEANSLKNFKEGSTYFIDFKDDDYELTNISNMFFGCDSLLSIKDISEWNTENVTNIASMFLGCKSLLSLPDISKWNTTNVENISNLFTFCTSLISLPDISKWDTKNVTNMNFLFLSCYSLTSLPDISKWDTNKCQDLKYLFNGCTSLVSLPDISKWDVSLVTSMMNMFNACLSLKSLPDLSKWNTASVNNMVRMFNNCESLVSLPDISNWNTEKVTDLSYMFNGCSSLISLPDISKWNTKEFININHLFNGCKSLLSLPDLSKWNNKNISNMNNIFSGCFSLTSIPNISKWNIVKVVEMNNMFEECSSLISIPEITKWDMSNVNNINNMFSKCFSLISLPDITKLNFSNLENKQNLVSDDCFSLVNLSKKNK